MIIYICKSAGVSGKSSIHGLCSIAMFDYWRVSLVNHKIYVNGVENLCLLMSIGGFILSYNGDCHNPISQFHTLWQSKHGLMD